MKFVIDIDGTICRSNSEYHKSEPIKDRIEWLNSQYDNGHQMVYFTARGMGTSKDNPISAYEKYYDLTKTQLDQWGVKYHNLILGKPSGDIYIDDRGVNADVFFGAINVSG